MTKRVETGAQDGVTHSRQAVVAAFGGGTEKIVAMVDVVAVIVVVERGVVVAWLACEVGSLRHQ